MRSSGSLPTLAIAITRRPKAGSKSTLQSNSAASPAIEREMRRRSVIEPVIDHLKNEQRMDRNHRHGDANNASRRRLQLPAPRQVAEVLCASS
jgi:hypothetical protein